MTRAEKGYGIKSGKVKIKVKIVTITANTGMSHYKALHSQRDYAGVLFIDVATMNFF